MATRRTEKKAGRVMVEEMGRRARKAERPEEIAGARIARERKSGEKVIKAFMMLAGETFRRMNEQMCDFVPKMRTGTEFGMKMWGSKRAACMLSGRVTKMKIGTTMAGQVRCTRRSDE